MARTPDFVVKFDPSIDTKESIATKIIYRLFQYPLKKHKPVVAFISGDSGEGKSWGILKVQETIMKANGLDLKDYLNDINIYTPLQYPEKMKALLFNKKLTHANNYKKVNMITTHEAREVVKAKQWQSFLTQAISDINAQSRRIKPLAIFIVSQFIRDITTDVRYTLNYYIKSYRLLGSDFSDKVRFQIFKLYKDDYDLEKPRLRKYPIWGYLVMPNMKRVKYTPRYLFLTAPSPEITEEFDKQDYESKHYILERKINKLIYEMKLDLENSEQRVKAMVDYYIKNPELLIVIGKRNRKNVFVIKKELKEMHGLNESEFVEFQNNLNESLKNITNLEEHSIDKSEDELL
jgi:hypothetical protein